MRQLPVTMCVTTLAAGAISHYIYHVSCHYTRASDRPHPAYRVDISILYNTH